jgi:hypothetical protein
MWNLLKNKECGRAQGCLEEAVVRHSGPITAEVLIAGLSIGEREHVGACQECQGAARDLVAARNLFCGVPRASEEERPFFAARVMAAIEARERELANLISPWSEVPRFASRLVWISAALLLAGTTWFYETRMSTPARSTSGDAGQDSIFETPTSGGQDDALISMAETNP